MPGMDNLVYFGGGAEPVRGSWRLPKTVGRAVAELAVAAESVAVAELAVAELAVAAELVAVAELAVAVAELVAGVLRISSRAAN